MTLKETIKNINSLQKERQRLEVRIKQTQDNINKLNARANRLGIASDVVACGRRGRKAIRTVKITGLEYDYASSHRLYKKLLLKEYGEKITEIDKKILEVEKMINEIEDPLLRAIIRERMDGNGWTKISMDLGQGSGSCVRMIYTRWLNSLENVEDEKQEND